MILLKQDKVFTTRLSALSALSILHCSEPFPSFPNQNPPVQNMVRHFLQFSAKLKRSHDGLERLEQD